MSFISPSSIAFRQKSRIIAPVIVFPNSKDFRISDNALLAEYSGGNYTPQTIDDNIRYTVGSRVNPGISNFCRHLRISSSIHCPSFVINRNSVASPTIRTEVNGGSTYGDESAGSAIGRAACKSAFGVNLRDAVFTSSAQSLMDQNYDRMRPDLTELSVPNFLLDLGQIKSLVKLWSPRRSLLSNAANLNLNVQYGWRPTIGDVSAMISSVRNLQQKIDDWNRSLGKLVKRRVTVLNDTISKSGTSSVSTWGVVTWSGNVTRKVTAHIVYRPLPLREMIFIERWLRGLLDSLGFELNPAIIWDAIPFSFVVDWFVNIGSYLDRLKLDTLELPIVLVDSYLQYKEVLVVNCTTFEPATVNYPAMTMGGSVLEERFFHRTRIAPTYSIASGLGWKFPSLNQAVLGLSLGFR